jgi:hypothetical protein
MCIFVYVWVWVLQVAIATYEARAMPQDHKGEIPSMAVSRNVF